MLVLSEINEIIRPKMLLFHSFGTENEGENERIN